MNIIGNYLDSLSNNLVLYLSVFYSYAINCESNIETDSKEMSSKRPYLSHKRVNWL